MHQKHPPANVALARSSPAVVPAARTIRLAAAAIRSDATHRMDQALLNVSATPFMQ